MDELSYEDLTADQGSSQDSPQELSYEDLAQPQSASAPQDQDGGEISYEDLSSGQGQQGDTPDASAPGSAVGGVGSFVREAARAVPSGLAARAAGSLAFEASIPFAPLAGPLAPAVPFVAGGLAALAAGWATSWSEDQVIAAMGMDKGSGMLSNAQRQADQSTFAGKAGNVAGNVVPGGAVGRGAMLGARAFGAGVGGGLSAGQQYIQTGSIDPTEVALNAAGGAAFPANSVRMDKLLSSKFPSYRGGNANPDLKPTGEEGTAAPAETPAEGAAAPAETPATTEDSEFEFGEDETPAAEKPVVPAAGEEALKAAKEQELGPAGTAVAQEAAPEIPGTGNPEGQGPGPAKAEGPENYGKDQAQTQPATTESKVVDTDLISGDTKSALPGAEPGEQVGSPGGESSVEAPVQRQEPAGTDVLPQAPEAAPTNPEPQPTGLGPEAEQPYRDQLAEREQDNPAPEAPAPEPVHGPTDDDYRTIPETPEQVEAPAPEENPLSPEELKDLHESKAIIAKHPEKFGDILPTINKATPRAQLEGLRKLATTLGAKAEGKVVGSDGNVRADSHAVVKDTNAQANNRTDKARNEHANKTYQDIYDKYGPHSDAGKAVDATDPAQRAPHVEKAWAEAKAALGGDPFVKVRPEHLYVPRKRTPKLNEAIEWVKAARNSANGKDHDTFAMLHSTPGTGELAREQSKIEGDTKNRREMIDNGEGESNRPAPEDWHDLPAKPVDLEQMTNPPDTPPVKEATEVPQFETKAEEIRAKTAKLRAQRLAMFGDKGKPPAGKIKGMALEKLTDEEATATEGEGEPEALDAKPQSSEETAAFLKKPEVAKVAAKASTDRDLEGMADSILKDSGWKDLGDKVGEFLGNEEGSGKIPAWVQSMFSKNNPVSPAAHDAITENVESMGHEFKRHIGREKNIMMQANAAIHAAPAAKQGVTPERYTAIAEAIQNRGTGSLNAADTKLYDDHVAPLRSMGEKLAREMHKIDQEDFGGHFKFPDPDIKGPAKDFMPRRLKGEQLYDKAEAEKYDALSGRKLSVMSPSMMQRDWFALHNPKTGDRLTLQNRKDKDGNTQMVIWRNGKQQILRNVPGDFEPAVDKNFTMKTKAGSDTWQIDNATNKEITENGRGEGGKLLEYHDNPVMMYAQQVTDLAKSLNNMKLLKSIKDSKAWQDNTTLSKDEAMAKGHDLNPVDIEALGRRNGQQVYMPAEYREALNDFFKKGFGGTELDPLRRASVNAYKTFFATSPFVHPLNVLDQTIVGRGWDNFTPSGVSSLVRNLPRAIRSVNTRDYHQTNMNAFGGNPMLDSVKIKSMWPDAANKFQMDIGKNPSKWDPIAKILDTTTPELARQFAKGSNDITWRLSDYMATFRYLENLDKGHSIESAVREMHESVPDYHIPTRVALPGKAGRLASTVLADPAFTSFGRYTYDRFAQLARMTKRTIAGTPEERKKALGQWATMAVLALLYKGADAGLRKLSGNKDAKLTRRGVSGIPQAIADSVNQQNVAPIQRLTTSSPAMNMLNAARTNQDWNGKPIMPEGVSPLTSPVRASGYVADYLARQYLSPYNVVGPALAKGQGVLPTAGRVLGEQIGAKFPTTGAQKWDNNRQKRINSGEKQRLKHGEPGVIPMAYDKVRRALTGH